jgi:hypothetical protein
MMECGQKLNAVKKEIDLFQQLAKTHSHPVLATYMQWYQDTITGLCDSRSSAAIPLASAEECKITDAMAIQLIQFMMPALYLGQHERVQFLAKKWNSLDSDQQARMPMRNILVSYYYGLASAGLYRRRKNRHLISPIDNSISVLAKGKCTLSLLVLMLRDISISMFVQFLQHQLFPNGISRQSCLLCSLKSCQSWKKMRNQVMLQPRTLFIFQYNSSLVTQPNPFAS